jgi:lipopolysaccharide transport system permease protein
MPISVSISSLYKFGVQFFLFLIVYLFFLFSGYNGHPTLYLILTPILLIFPAIFGLSLGLIVSSLTIKYRDLNFLTGVLIQILMYGSSIVYSISDLDAKYINFLRWNPMVWVMEAFRFSFLGVGVWSWAGLSYALLVMIFLMLLALITFNKTEKNFIDVI